MAKYDAARIAETAEPFADGTSGIEPLCDEFGRLIAAPVAGGGGGGDASAANQLTAISRLDTLIADLGTRVSEVTGQDIVAATQEVRDAIVALGDGTTLFDLFSRLGDIDSRLTADALVQADISSYTQLSTLALQAMEPDIEEIRGDADATRIAVEATSAAIGTTGDADTDNTVVGRLKNLLSRIPTALVAGKFDVNVEAFREFATFTVTTGAQALPLAQGSILSIALAALSPVAKLRILDIRIRNLQTANIAGERAKFELRRFATHSVGTVLTPQTPDSANSLSGNITVRRGATLAGEGAAEIYPAWYFATDEYGVGATEIEAQQAANQNTHSLLSQIRGAQYPTVRPGEGVSVRLSTTLVAASTFEVTIQFTQE